VGTSWQSLEDGDRDRGGRRLWLVVSTNGTTSPDKEFYLELWDYAKTHEGVGVGG